MQTRPVQFKLVILLLVVCLGWITLSSNAAAQSSTGTPLVQAVLFYRSSCSHCVQLVVEVMPPILEKYGQELQIFYCDVSKPEGDALFTAAIDRFKIKTIGVPTVIVGNDVLIGSRNIQEQFSGIIEAGLSRGGLGWPDIPGLAQAFTSAGSMQIPVFSPPGSYFSDVPTPVAAVSPVEPQGSTASPLIRAITKMRNNFLQDLRGNSLSVIVLVGLIASLIYGIYAFLNRNRPPLAKGPAWVIPLLCALGIGISAYLAYVEITLADAICGSVGNCETVQLSRYSRLFGFLPMGLAGIAGYLAVVLAWGVARRGRGAAWAGLALLGLTLAGVLFSIYLTFLEPFVIGATCLWCLSSAILMAVLMLMSISPGKMACNALSQNNRLRS
jgi:uncharacterized membrane protein